MASDPDLSIREKLRSLDPSSAHNAGEAPNLDTIYTPSSHAEALDPERALVVGGRGVGKSFWASVLHTQEARNKVSIEYPRLNLNRLHATLGFHEGARGSRMVAPSPQTLQNALKSGAPSLTIWQAVLIRALEDLVDFEAPEKLADRISWIQNDPEGFEDVLLKADERLSKKGERFLLVFDALDRLAQDWETIRELTKGVAILALDLRSMRSIRTKIFMRRDQFNDEKTMGFPDSSKMRTAAVKLEWSRTDLYGLLFSLLWQDKASGTAIRHYVSELGFRSARLTLPSQIKEGEEAQQKLFSKISGEFMGANHRRGRTYSWVYTHLADAFEETSPRSFLIALRAAAEKTGRDVATAIDHHGIREGVVKASDTRVDELQEDHPWVRDALSALGELTVPCPPDTFVDRWKEHKTIRRIQSRSDQSRPITPVELELRSSAPEEALLEALVNLGVVERRESVGRINVPDIYRVAANLKRRGGVPPRKSRAT